MAWPPIASPASSDDEGIAELNTFLLEYGHTLAAWAFLEEALCQNFQCLLKADAHLARLLFFSGRSFATRADLYSAAITGAPHLSAIRRDAHKALLKRSRQFGAARNAIAHAIPRKFTNEGEGARLKQGHKLWELGGVSYNDLTTACGNFQALSRAADTLLIPTPAWRKKKSDELAERCLRQVHALPSQAFPRGDDLNQQEGE